MSRIPTSALWLLSAIVLYFALPSLVNMTEPLPVRTQADVLLLAKGSMYVHVHYPGIRKDVGNLLEARPELACSTEKTRFISYNRVYEFWFDEHCLFQWGLVHTTVAAYP